MIKVGSRCRPAEEMVLAGWVVRNVVRLSVGEIGTGMDETTVLGAPVTACAGVDAFCAFSAYAPPGHLHRLLSIAPVRLTPDGHPAGDQYPNETCVRLRR